MNEVSKENLFEIVKSFYLLPFQENITEKIMNDTLRDIEMMNDEEIYQFVSDTVLPETIRIVELSELIKIKKTELNCVLNHLDNLVKSPKHNDMFINWAIKNLAKNKKIND